MFGVAAIAAAAVIIEEREREVVNNLNRRLRIMKRTLRDASDPFMLQENYFRKHYR